MNSAPLCAQVRALWRAIHTLAVDRCTTQEVMLEESMWLAREMPPAASGERQRSGPVRGGLIPMVTTHPFSINQGHIDLGLNVASSFNNILKVLLDILIIYNNDLVMSFSHMYVMYIDYSHLLTLSQIFSTHANSLPLPFLLSGFCFYF